jgi:hypothetical protein
VGLEDLTLARGGGGLARFVNLGGCRVGCRLSASNPWWQLSLLARWPGRLRFEFFLVAQVPAIGIENNKQSQAWDAGLR